MYVETHEIVFQHSKYAKFVTDNITQICSSSFVFKGQTLKASKRLLVEGSLTSLMLQKEGVGNVLNTSKILCVVFV